MDGEIPFDGLNEPENYHLDWKCEHCCQEFSIRNFKTALMLYGIFVLSGDEYSYIGTTCPKCLKTIYVKGKNDTFIEDVQSDIILFPTVVGGIHYLSELWYDSTTTYFTWQLPLFCNANVHIAKFSRFKEYQEMYGASEHERKQYIESLHESVQDNPELKGKYCSYNEKWGKPFGWCFNILWVEEDEIENLINLENEHKISLIPRYSFSNDLILKLINFCWECKISKESDLDLYSERDVKNISEIRSDFLKILTIADIRIRCNMSYDFSEQEFNDFLFRVVNPFKDIGMPFSTSELDRNIWEISDIRKWAISAYDLIESQSAEAYVQDFFQDNYMNYINDYVDLVQKSDFSNAMIFEVNRKYIIKLENIIKKEALSKSRYAIYEESPTWTIIFNGKTSRGLKQRGFKYIAHLVTNKFEEIHTDVLSDLDGVELIDIKHEDKEFSWTVSKAKDGKKIDRMAKIDYDIELERLQEALKEAEGDVDPLIRIEAEKELMDFLYEYEKAIGIGGKIREFKSNSKKVKDRITKAIERAINELKDHNVDLYNHFKISIQPINTFKPCYDPREDIDWNLMPSHTDN